jgi:hypothetical protein
MFWPVALFLSTTVIITTAGIQPLRFNTPLISPGAHHSIFNSYCSAAPTVDQAVEVASLRSSVQYHHQCSDRHLDKGGTQAAFSEREHSLL